MGVRAFTDLLHLGGTCRVAVQDKAIGGVSRTKKQRRRLGGAGSSWSGARGPNGRADQLCQLILRDWVGRRWNSGKRGLG